MRIEYSGTSNSTRSFQGSDTVIYVGVDIAKGTHVAVSIDTNAVVLFEPFVFQNDHEGFQLLKAETQNA